MAGKDMEPWERALLVSTYEFVKKVLPDNPQEDREMAVARIYSDMRRVLKQFHKDDTP